MFSPRLSDPRPRHWGNALLMGLICLAASRAIAAPAVVVAHLRNGDQITGELIAQETNHVVIATGWAGTLVLPLTAIGGLQTTTGEKLIPAPAPPPAPAPAAKQVAAQVVAPPKKSADKIQTDLQLGSNLNFGARDSQLAYARLKLTHTHPYRQNPKKFLRTVADFAADYGETENVRSANRLSGSFKTDFDAGDKSYFYNLASSGFDEIRRINLHYAIGPGLGYHLLKQTTFQDDLEGGFDYQVQDRSLGADTSSAYFRFSNALNWKITPRLSFSKRFEYFVNGEELSQYRFRIDSSLQYQLVKNLSLNLSLLDTFDTDPAPRVNKNEMQIRSTIGITF